MNTMVSAIWVEWLKASRSRVPPITMVSFAAAPLVGGLFMLILQHPEWGERAGLLTTKAQITTDEATWSEYLSLLTQATAIGGFVVFGIAVIWLFGREFSDRTYVDLMALPTSRVTIVGAKYVVLTIWAAIAQIVVVITGLGIGGAIRLPGWSGALFRDSLGDIARMALLALLLVTPFGLIASRIGGFFVAMGSLIGTVVLAMVLAATGWGVYFPWSIPGLASGAAGPEAAILTPLSYLLVVVASVAGIAGTVYRWQRADYS